MKKVAREAGKGVEWASANLSDICSDVENIQGCLRNMASVFDFSTDEGNIDENVGQIGRAMVTVMEHCAKRLEYVKGHAEEARTHIS